MCGYLHKKPILRGMCCRSIEDIPAAVGTAGSRPQGPSSCDHSIAQRNFVLRLSLVVHDMVLTKRPDLLLIEAQHRCAVTASKLRLVSSGHQRFCVFPRILALRHVICNLGIHSCPP